MHLCFWLFFSEEKKATEQSNYVKSFNFLSSSLAKKEFSCSWLITKFELFDNRFFLRSASASFRCLSKSLNQILVRTENAVETVWRKQKTCFPYATRTSLTNFTSCLSGSGLSHSLPPSDPHHMKQRMFTYSSGVTHTRMNKKKV